jgi:tripartite-type tricarboxylate transporter receptor subunit TctC
MLHRRTFAVGAAALVAAPMLRAQTLPNGPVRIVVGFAPGGGTDILARVIGQKLGEMWKTSILVENRAGATGVIAADYVAKQPADGNTLLMAHINSHAIAPALFPKMNYDAVRDFTPIVMVGVTPNLLICGEHEKARTVKDLVELCKANPNKVSFGSAGTGSAQHLALEMFKLQAGVQALHIPYKGSGPMLTDLIGGQINYSFDTMTAATPHVKSGKAIALAQTREKRAKGHPTVPTMAESGFPGFEATTWYGLAGPRNMPAAMVKRMNEDINKVLAMPDVMEKFEQYGAEDGGGSTEKFAAFIRSELVKWAKVVKDANVKMDA